MDRVAVRLDPAAVAVDLWVDPTDHIGRFIARSGRFYEADLLLHLRALARGGVYLDVGAHVGNHAVAFVECCGAKHVIAFEPNPLTFALLTENSIRRNISPIHAAVHDHWGTVDVQHVEGNSGMSTVVEHGNVLAVALDLFGDEPVGLVKIDTEGQGVSVLRSGLGLLMQWHPVVAVETRDEREAMEVGDLMATLEYRTRTGPFGDTPTWVWQ